MAIETLYPACGSLVGGVAALKMIDAERLALPSFEEDARSCSMPEVSDGGEWATVAFVEGSCSYTQKVSYRSQLPEVRHTLRFTLPDNEPSQRFVAQLEEASRNTGIVAIVTLQNQRQLLVALSPALGTEQPLRLVETTISTNTKREDRRTIEVQLECCTECCAATINI